MEAPRRVALGMSWLGGRDVGTLIRRKEKLGYGKIRNGVLG
jgi:hypothetical protein